MRRRAFISLLGGAAAWPLAASAQTGKLVRLGYLEGGARADSTTQNLRHQFVLGMRDLGYNEGRDYVLEERYAAGQLDSFPTYARELVELPVDIIVAGGEAAIRAAKRATSQIPIVMTLAADPIGSGLVPNLAHPGGNLTGMSALASDLAGKRVELLKELVPKARRVVVLWNPSNQSKVTEWKDTQIAAQSVALILGDARRARPRARGDQARAAGCHDRVHGILHARIPAEDWRICSRQPSADGGGTPRVRGCGWPCKLRHQPG
jgi:putative tryptophan/tyrosine transport system substrate-binding protein